ncbi:MAG: hypothetical protein ACRDLZ_09440 [Gaiellaceae bacterium]
MLGAAALAGCADSDPDIGEPAGPPLSIEDALAAASDEPHVLRVRGNLLAQGGSARLCSALAESFPPQCGGASLVVEGLELEAVTGLVTEGDISWTDRPVELLGVVSDGTLTVSENAR